MKFEIKLRDVQRNLLEQGIEGWLLFDFRRSNPLAYDFLEIPPSVFSTRRFFYWIPQEGDPIKIVSLIEPYTLDHLPGIKQLYRGWQELEQVLFCLVDKKNKIAMEYSPCNALPAVSRVDAGTVELVQRGGATVVSSANLLQRYTSLWSSEQLESHVAAAKILEEIVDQTWAWIGSAVKRGDPLNEYQVQQFMLRAMEESDCQTDHPPTCAVNAHSADPHYYPGPQQATLIHPGDFILLDLWCKQKKPRAIYADITRVGVAASRPTGRQQEIFNLVKEARDRATFFIRDQHEKHLPMQGWQVDQVCRSYLEERGYGQYFIHRTGHHIGEDVHGPGANLDNLETHDYRELLPGTGFSVEPGIYLPGEFGVRLEYDLYLHPSGQVSVTGGVQEEVVCLLI